MVGMLKTKDLKNYLTGLEVNGCVVNLNKEAGTVEAMDQDDVIVLKGLQKEKNGPWIVRYNDSDRIKWNSAA